MSRPAASKRMMILLSLNAAVLLFAVLALLSRSELVPSAFAQAPTDSEQHVIVVPGQLSANMWGCYVVDTRAGTLLVYQYSPGDKLLRLQAARGIEQDLQLRSFNTSPLPREVAELIEKERKLQSGLPAATPAGESGKK